MVKTKSNYKDGDLLLEIYHITDGNILKFPAYQSEYYSDIEDYEKMPLSSYYYEAVHLLTYYKRKENSKIIIDFIDTIEKLWFCCNRDNIKEINAYLRSQTFELGEILLSSRGDYNKFNGDFNNNFNPRLPPNFEEIFNKWSNDEKNKKIYDKFKNGKGNCVAIALPFFHDLRDANNCFLSVSGAFKDYGGKTLSFCVNKQIRDVYDAVNDLIELIFKFRFVECHLLDETMRYTEYSTEEQIDSYKYNGKVLAEPISFIVDFGNYYFSDRRVLARHYSCCEKKILAYMGFVNKDYRKLLSGIHVINHLSSYIFRIRYEPCRMCRPALIGCYFIQNCFSNDLLNFISCNFDCSDNKEIALNITSNPDEPLIVMDRDCFFFL